MKTLFVLFFLIASSYCSFDPSLTKNLFYLNAATYCRPSKVKDWTCGPCNHSDIKLANVQPFYNKTGDILGIIGVAKAPQSLIVVFRGSDPRLWKNFIQDINFLKTSFPTCDNKCQVHRGFYHAYLEVEEAVIKTTKQYIQKYKIINTIVVGHSLGGALATYAAISLVKSGIQVTQLYTFGSPRVGDAKFSEWFDKFIKTNSKNRVTHHKDPVPHLPFHQWGFNHVPHEIYQKGAEKDGYIICNDTAVKQDPNCADKNKVDVNILDHGDYCGINFVALVQPCF